MTIEVRPPMIDGFQPEVDEVCAGVVGIHLERMASDRVWMAIGEGGPDRVAVVISAERKWWRPWRPYLRITASEE